MLFQSIAGFEWVIGVGLAVGLAFTLDYLTFKDIKGFFIFLTIFIGFMVWAGMLELWSLVMCIIVLTVLIILEVKSGMSGGVAN